MPFSALLVTEEQQNRRIAKLLRRDLTPKEQDDGYIYIAKQSDGKYCKVGFTKKDVAQRIKAIGKCDIVTSSSSQIGSFVGAFRAEQLVHKLLFYCRCKRYNCLCGCKNREWYEIPYQQVKEQVLTVFSWFRANPYGRGIKPKELEGVWRDALKRWEATQESPRPLKWDAFFINGPAMATVVVASCRTPSRQYELSGHPSTTKPVNRSAASGIRQTKLKILLKRGLKRARLGLSHHDGNWAKGSFLPKVRPMSSGQTTSDPSRDSQAEGEEPDATPRKHSQTRRQRTWDHWFDAEDRLASDVTANDARTKLQQTDTTNTLHESPSVSSLEDLASIPKPGSVKPAQENLLLPVSEHDNDKSSSLPGTDYTSAGHCFQATPKSTKDGSCGNRRVGEEDIAPQVGASSRYSDEMIEIVAQLANMPGAFPDEEIEESPPAVSTPSDAPRTPNRIQNSVPSVDTRVQEPLDVGKDQGEGGTPVDHVELVVLSSDVAQSTGELLSNTTLPVGKGSTNVTVAISTPKSEEVQLEKIKKSTLLNSDAEPEATHIAAWRGTAMLSFQPYEEREGSITYEPFEEESAEEEPAEEDSAEEESAEDESVEDESVEDSSDWHNVTDWDTASSLSDDDRPRRRQRALERELIGLSEEHNYYTDQKDVDTLQGHDMDRIAKLRKKLKKMDLGRAEEEGEEEEEEDEEEEEEGEEVEEDEPLFPLKNWGDEPSDDNSAELDCPADEGLHLRHREPLGGGDSLFEKLDSAGQAAPEVLASRKILHPKGRIPRQKNTQQAISTDRSKDEPKYIAEKPHWPASSYTERITFRMKERYWGDLQRPVKVVF